MEAFVFCSNLLGVKYHDNRLSFTNLNKHVVSVRLGDLPFPEAMEEYVFTGFVSQNQLILEPKATQSSDSNSKLTAWTIFLPMVFPKLYQAMAASYKQQYESVALGSCIKHAERMHVPYEKSPKDYITFFNAKGFYFVKGNDGFEVKSIYTDDRTRVGDYSCRIYQSDSVIG